MLAGLCCTLGMARVAVRGPLQQAAAPLLHAQRCGGRAVRMMALKTGIVGMPNVGKSTLFNALMEDAQAQAANFPFCTIEPNVGVVAVPDPRLDVLAEISQSAKTVPTSLSFVDIAGLVAGASRGEGLGNQFLANIRECDAIVHVVRCFEDDNVIHVSGSVEPLRDIEVISLELALADLAQVERRQAKAAKDKKTAPEELAALAKLNALLDEGTPARKAELTPAEAEAVAGLQLLTQKPVIYAANVGDAELGSGNAMVDRVRELAESEAAAVVVVSAQVCISPASPLHLRCSQVESQLTELGDLISHLLPNLAGRVGAGRARRRGALGLLGGPGRGGGRDRTREADQRGVLSAAASDVRPRPQLVSPEPELGELHLPSSFP